MFKTYDTTQQAYKEHLPKNYDVALGAWIESPSAKTYDTTQNAWVERLYKYWFRSVNIGTAEQDMFDVDKSAISLNVDSTYSTRTRNVTYKCSEHDIENGDTIKFGLLATVGISVSVSVSYTKTDGSSGTHTIYSKTASGAEVSDTISRTISASDVKTWGDLVVAIVYSYDSSTPYATAAIFDISVKGKKYGFK